MEKALFKSNIQGWTDMKLNKIKDPLDMMVITIILLDIFSVLIFPMHILRGIVWFLFVPILMIFNAIRSKRISNLLLLIYELFLSACNVMSFFIYDIVRFAVTVDNVSWLLKFNDEGIYYMLLIFVHPITMGIIALMIAGIIRLVKKKRQSQG